MKKLLHARPAHSDMAFLQEIQGHWGLAYSLAAIARTEEAEAHYQQSLQLYRKAQADNPRVLRQLPQNYYQYLAAHMERSKAEKALKLNPNNAEAHASLAKILSRQGEAEKAHAHFKKAIELDPSLPFCVLNNCM